MIYFLENFRKCCEKDYCDGFRVQKVDKQGSGLVCASIGKIPGVQCVIPVFHMSYKHIYTFENLLLKKI